MVAFVGAVEADSNDDTVSRLAKPFERAGTLLVRVECGTKETLQLHGGAGGSHVDGVPYMEHGDEWPSCGHGLAMRHVLQIDSRDALHSSELQGLFVVFVCSAPLAARFASFKAGEVCAPHVRHYGAPLAERRRNVAAVAQAKAWRLVAMRVASFLPGSELAEWVVPALVAQLTDAHPHEYWGRAYSKMMEQTGMGRLLYEEHLGGWHVTNPDRNYLPPPCPACGERPPLVVQTDCGDGNQSLWACPSHPAHAHFAFHK